MLTGRQLLSGAILHVPVVAQAQISSQAAPPSGQADAGREQSDEIVVTAQRRSARLQDVPIPVTVQAGAQLASAGVNNIRGVDGFALVGTGSGTGTASAIPNNLVESPSEVRTISLQATIKY